MLHLVFYDVGVFFICGDSHALEAMMDENQADDEDRGAEGVSEVGGQFHGDRDGKEVEERGEFVRGIE